MKQPHAKKGDTLIEVMMAVGIFGIVAVGAISIMNRGLYDAQRALEITMARNEIDAQAEALRFIHSAYISETQSYLVTRDTTYSQIWGDIVEELIYKPSSAELNHFFDSYNNEPCNKIYSSNAFPDNSFVINIRHVDNEDAISIVRPDLEREPEPPYGENEIQTIRSAVQIEGTAIVIKKAFRYTENGAPLGSGENVLEQTPTYPRLLFSRTGSFSDNDINATTNYQKNLIKAQGIWVTGVASDESAKPEYYDFHIRTCWDSPGSNLPNTISTTIRLFNPE